MNAIEKHSIPKSQQERVIAVCCDGQFRTLERIQLEIKRRFNKYDTATAISARLRERTINQNTGKPVYYYTLRKVTNAISIQ